MTQLSILHPLNVQIAPFLARVGSAPEPIEEEVVDYGVPVSSIVKLFTEDRRRQVEG